MYNIYNMNIIYNSFKTEKRMAETRERRPLKVVGTLGRKNWGPHPTQSQSPSSASRQKQWAVRSSRTLGTVCSFDL